MKRPGNDKLHEWQQQPRVHLRSMASVAPLQPSVPNALDSTSLRPPAPPLSMGATLSKHSRSVRNLLGSGLRGTAKPLGSTRDLMFGIKESSPSPPTQRKRTGFANLAASHAQISAIIQEKLPENVEDWSVTQVQQWVGSIQGGSYIHNFASNFVDGETLANVDDDFLQYDLKISNAAIRKRILSRLDELRGPRKRQESQSAISELKRMVESTESQMSTMRQTIEQLETEQLQVTSKRSSQRKRVAGARATVVSNVDVDRDRLHKDMAVDALVKKAATDGAQRIVVSHELSNLLGNMNPRMTDEVKKLGLLHPSHPYRGKWDTLIVILVIYYAVMTPVNMGFDANTENVFVEIFFNFLFITDMILNFVTPYKVESGPDAGTMECDRRLIAKRYLNKWFWIDLVASFPVDLILLAVGSEHSVDGINKLLKLLRGFKLARVFRMTRLLQRLMSQYRINPAILRLAKLFGILVVMWHWIGCFYWLISSSQGIGSTRWTPRIVFEHRSVGTQYLQAFYWAVMVTTGVGRDIDPVTNIETLYTLFSIVTGVLMYAFIVGSASTAMSDIDTNGAEQRRRVEAISQFLLQKHVPTQLRNQILMYYDYTSSQETNFGSQEDMLSDLHVALRKRLHRWINRDLIATVPMFKDMSDDCQEMLMSHLSSHIYLPLEVVAVERQKSQGLFFVVRGRFEVWENGVNLSVLRPGDTIGKRALLTADRRSTTVRAATHGELLLLRRKHFRDIVSKFPEFAASLQKYMYQPPGIFLKGWQKIKFVVRMTRMTKLLGAEKVSFKNMMLTVNRQGRTEQ